MTEIATLPFLGFLNDSINILIKKIVFWTLSHVFKSILIKKLLFRIRR